MSRNEKIWTGVAVALAVAALSYFTWDVYLTRPKVEPIRADPADALGVDRSSAIAPPFELAALDGSRVSLSKLKGQVVFVNFWATWCPPCRDEMPSMVRLGRALESRHPGRFKMVAISVDDGWDPVKEYFAAPPFGGPPPGVTVALDTSGESARAYYCTARGFCPDIKFPETYIVDPKGKLVGYVVGPRDWSQPAAFEYLDRLIGS
jgi:thiol-disulfide isomerase/thioredoxin